MNGQTVRVFLLLVVWFLVDSALADPLPSVQNSHEFSLFQDDQRFTQSVGGSGARVPGTWESFCSSEFSVIFCNIVGEFFDDTGGKVDFVADVQCDEADPSNPDDPRASTDCGCVLTSATDATGLERNDCSCQVCPNGVGFAPIAVSCQEPIVGSCSSVDCNRECDGSCFPDSCPIPNNAPRVSLISPRQGQQFVLADLILLSASAVDLEDDAKGDVVQVVWTINGFEQTFASNNVTIRADTLGEGPQLISVYAIDSASLRSNTASVTITIFDTLPPTSAPSPGLPTSVPTLRIDVGTLLPTDFPTSRGVVLPSVTVISPAEDARRFRFDQTIQIQAIATDGEDIPLPMNWTLNTFEQGRLDDLGRVDVKASSIGVAVHRIQIYALDSRGNRGQVEFTVLVEAPQCEEEISSSLDEFLIDFFEPLEPEDEQTFTETFIETYRGMNRDNCFLQKFDAFLFVANAPGRRLTRARSRIRSSCRCPKCQGTIRCYFSVGRRLEKNMVWANETLPNTAFNHRRLQEDPFIDQCVCRRTNEENTFDRPNKEQFISRLNAKLVESGISQVRGFDIVAPPTNQSTKSPTKSPTKKPTEPPSPSPNTLELPSPSPNTCRAKQVTVVAWKKFRGDYDKK